MSKRHYLRQSGFTLMELLLVVVIIGLLATFILPGIFKQFIDTQPKIAKAQIASIESQIVSYRLNMGKYPRSLDNLVKSPGNPKWKGPYLKESQLIDPWGNKYQFKQPGKGGRDYELLSYGADGAQGGEGENADITNWQ